MHTIVELPDRCVAAASGGGTVWVATLNRLLGFSTDGTRQFDAPCATGVTHLAMRGALLIGAHASGRVSWMDPTSGVVRGERETGGVPTLTSGGGAVWAVDRTSSRAWRVGEPGSLEGPRRVLDVNQVAADGDRLWWTTTNGGSLRDLDRLVDLDVGRTRTGALAVCAGSAWVSSHRGLVRVGTWAGTRGAIVEAPFGPVPFLSCADGVLVGASSGGQLFALDTRVDADARRVDVEAGATGALVTAGRTVWLFSSVEPTAHLVVV